ncbi:hypothetical protein F4808DRAFT_151892 [Astrocystis sublimbata]|nr:hypothetical protein F4808DRAFT_151892 [Astrocystis sublimbata]
MTTVLGKRKSRTQKATDGPSIPAEEAQAKLAKFFEAQFKPLVPATAQPTPAPEIEDARTSESEPEGSDDDGSWGGLSEDEGEDGDHDVVEVEVVAHTDAYTTTIKTIDKRESRAWLSSRPPVPNDPSASSSSSTNKKGKTSSTADEDAPSLLRNDLALQRLLSESHLFSSAAAKNSHSGRGGEDPGDATEHVGRNRHLATDLRLAALGSKKSIYKQEKMPMSHRKGINAAAEDRETRRRREAKENGIVLERPGGVLAGGKQKGTGNRKGALSAIDAPAVGRMNGGMLKLGKRDIASIEAGGGRGRGGGALGKRRRR